VRNKVLLGIAASLAVAGGGAAVAVHADQVKPIGTLPNRQLTPGAWDSSLTVDYLCTHPTDERRNVTAATKHKVFASYKIAYPSTPSSRGQWEVDHLVPLSLGGTNDTRNLWPEQAPGFHDKDKLELRLRTLVCSHQLDLRTAQRAIATDWKSAYATYVVATKKSVPADGSTP
jgi:5-methylcytosine-specific restriction endonuclease McrA